MIPSAAPLLSIVLTSAVASAAPLSIEQVLPERTALALSVSGLDAVMERLDSAGVLEAIMNEAGGDPLRHVVETLPEHLHEPVQTAMGDQEPTEALKELSMGGGVWPMDNPSGEIPIEWAAWIELGESARTMGPIIDEHLQELRRDPDSETVRVLDVDVDRYARASEGFLIAHREGTLMMSSSTDGMERMLSVQNGDPAPGIALGESETWMAAADLMGATSGVRAVLMPEVALDIVQMSPQGAMVGMVRPVSNSVLGRHEAIAMRLDAGEDEVILQARGGTVMPDGVEGLLSLLGTSPADPGRMRRFAGNDTVAVAAASIDIASLTSLVEELLASSPLLFAAQQPWEQMRPVMEDLTGPLGGQMVQVTSVQQPITAESLVSLMVFEVKDPRALEEGFGAHLATAGFKAREFQGHQIWSMTMPSMMPGVPETTMTLCVAGEWMLMGEDAGVEAGLRRLSASGDQAPWIPERQPLGVDAFQNPAMAGMMDLHGSFATMLEIDELQVKRMRESLQAEDPELWEELAGDIAAEDDSMFKQAKSLASVLGILLWMVERTDTGFGVRAFVTAPADG